MSTSDRVNSAHVGGRSAVIRQVSADDEVPDVGLQVRVVHLRPHRCRVGDRLIAPYAAAVRRVWWSSVPAGLEAVPGPTQVAPQVKATHRWVRTSG